MRIPEQMEGMVRFEMTRNAVLIVLSFLLGMIYERVQTLYWHGGP
jgi:hypothetical protein